MRVWILLSLVQTHDPHRTRSPTFTLVTALAPEKQLAWPQQLQLIKHMAAADRLNLVVVGDGERLRKIPQEAANNRTVFYENDSAALGDVWREVKGKVGPRADERDLSRLLWLNFVREHDKFDTDQYLWVDLEHFGEYKELLTF